MSLNAFTLERTLCYSGTSVNDNSFEFSTAIHSDNAHLVLLCQNIGLLIINLSIELTLEKNHGGICELLNMRAPSLKQYFSLVLISFIICLLFRRDNLRLMLQLWQYQIIFHVTNSPSFGSVPSKGFIQIFQKERDQVKGIDRYPLKTAQSDYIITD